MRSILYAAPATLVYLVLLPWVGRALDTRVRIGWSVPAWLFWPAIALVLGGAALALWAVWLFSTMGRGTPNPISPPRNLVVCGPFAHTRNPIMLGAWAVGLGLALLLRSPALLVAYLIIALAGTVYVRRLEEPALLVRFGEPYEQYKRSVPRWLLVCVLCGLGAAEAHAQPRPTPTLVVQIKFKPGAGDLWKKAFREYVAPSIQEAIANHDEITRFTYLETVVPGQPYDFLLLLQSRSFAFFDQPRPYPHYSALVRRAGREQAGKILAEMESWEQTFSVSLLRGYEGVP
jgi:protein-S-isoprenylcysteine O-methyltransferase Ste14